MYISSLPNYWTSPRGLCYFDLVELMDSTGIRTFDEVFLGLLGSFVGPYFTCGNKELI